jgi:hypothetical protein
VSIFDPGVDRYDYSVSESTRSDCGIRGGESLAQVEVLAVVPPGDFPARTFMRGFSVVRDIFNSVWRVAAGLAARGVIRPRR